MFVKNTNTRAVALMLTLSLAGSVFLSCSQNQSSDNGTTAAGSRGGSTAISETTGQPRLKPDLEDRDFGGLEITLFGRNYDEADAVKMYSETSSEFETGEVMNDAVYKRNRYIEQKYNVAIKGKISEDFATLLSDIQKEIKAGDNTFDAAFASVSDAATLSQSGFLVDLHTVPNIDLSKPWWDQRAVADLSVGGKLFFTVGDITPWAYAFPEMFIVNKELLQKYALGNPYDDVRNNNWTFDRLGEYVRAVQDDLNGDGVIGTTDLQGLAAYRDTFSLMLLGGGESVFKKDSNDIPYFALNTERAVNVAEKLYNLLTEKNSVLIREDYPEDDFGDPYGKFRNGASLFITTWMSLVAMYRDLDMDIGLLPQPKYDSAQEFYSHPLSEWWTSALVIPQTNRKLDETGFILEALCAEGMYTVRPAFYESTLKGKMLRDDDSEEMLDIILNSRTFDLGRIYGWGGVMATLNSVLAQKTFVFASSMERLNGTVDTAIEKALAKFVG
ncbi:hypothetical protein FACS1894105_01690 [Clostridia bacterium]|nr:hypothetical protein FACS1894105_01690 [Clostridia bacterium]